MPAQETAVQGATGRATGPRWAGGPTALIPRGHRARAMALDAHDESPSSSRRARGDGETRHVTSEPCVRRCGGGGSPASTVPRAAAAPLLLVTI